MYTFAAKGGKLIIVFTILLNFNNFNKLLLMIITIIIMSLNYQKSQNVSPLIGNIIYNIIILFYIIINVTLIN